MKLVKFKDIYDNTVFINGGYVASIVDGGEWLDSESETKPITVIYTPCNSHTVFGSVYEIAKRLEG